jgi:hypothetical protein
VVVYDAHHRVGQLEETGPPWLCMQALLRSETIVHEANNTSHNLIQEEEEEAETLWTMGDL